MQTPSQTDLVQGNRQLNLLAQSLAGSRLCKHADYQRAYAAARKRQSSSMSWFLAPRQFPGETSASAKEPMAPRVGLTVGKVIGKAHERNRIKRRLREVLRRHVELLPPGCDLILHPRRILLSIEFAKLEAEILRILAQANAEASRKPVIQGLQPAPPAPAL
jgi:ribonuclease P protein component